MERVSGEQLQAQLVPGAFVFVEKTDREVEGFVRRDTRVIRIRVSVKNLARRGIETALVCGKAVLEYVQLALQPTRK